MKIVFISNFFNHHQKPLSDAFFRLTEGDYRFIETGRISIERLKLGWGMKEYPDYVLRCYTDKKSFEHCKQLVDEADVVITGSAPAFFIKNRLKQKKLVFRYSERVYKEKCKWYELPLRAVKYYFKHGRHKNLYLLCASAYTAGDYAKTGTFLRKTYKWGYFTEVKQYDNINVVLQQKERNSLLWVARLIELKHPECPIEIVKQLKKDGYDPHLRLIGVGELEEEISKKIQAENLEQNVQMLGSMSPDKVREYMEQSEIFLFTSDRNEGWGAVLNEAMNSGCAVVASHAIGSVPFLVKDKENGLIYKDGDLEDLYQKTKWLLDNSEKRVEMGVRAYRTMNEQWNAENAASRFLCLAEKILNKEKPNTLYQDGVCSRAERIKDNWYKRLKTE